MVTLLTDPAGEEDVGDSGLLEDLRAGPPGGAPDAANEANIDCDRQLWLVRGGHCAVAVDNIDNRLSRDGRRHQWMGIQMLRATAMLILSEAWLTFTAARSCLSMNTGQCWLNAC